MKFVSTILSLLLLAFAHASQAQNRVASIPSGVVIDLSHPFETNTVYWPTAEGFRLEKDFEGMTEKGFYYSAYRYSSAEHGGTHIDAPVHFAKGRNSVDDIPLNQLMGSAVVIDVTQQCAKDRDYLVTETDITSWERQNGRIAPGTIIFLRTGFGRFYPDRKRYLGTDERGEGAVANLHFPGLHPNAARWLVRNRSIKAIGLDTASIDHGQSTLFESHRILFEKNIPAFENVANLHQLPTKGFAVVALPMKIKSGSGGPLRIVAIVPRRR
ncbi:MAG TPA: cyclase family protein [Pyrinomonadaceae bacterium]|nr:cyclase family protein [Pyrinomonadaceae bacterium]